MKVASLIAAALLLAMPAAHAARDISAPARTFTIAQDGSQSISLGTTFAGAASGDFFANRYDFTLAGDAYLAANITSNSIDLTGFGLYRAGSDALLAAGIPGALRGGEKYELTVDTLGAGRYYLLASGVIGSGGASFAGNGVFELAPVPEPRVPAMLLAGLAVLAIAARRGPRQQAFAAGQP